MIMEETKVLMTWPDDYEDEEGNIEDDFAMDDFYESLDSYLNLYNEGYYWKVVGHHMGWRKMEGHNNC